jgi:DNA-binding SARP family transcriptional activator/tetratricopeptide (TPR) repeat protein
VEFEVLGAVRLRHAGDAPARLGRLQRTLLAVLLVHANRQLSADLLTDVLWPDAEAHRAEQNLRLHVHRLRRALGDPNRLAFDSGGYRLTVSPGELDAERFETLVDEATELADHEPERAVDLLRKALGLWQGDAYDGVDLPVVVDEAQRLGDRRLAAIEALYEAELASGRDATIVSDLTDLARRYPLRERIHALLMTALYRAGRQADALQVYQTARRALVDEIGLEPGPELRAIEQQVLAGEPVDLGGPAAGIPVPAQLPANIRGFVGRDEELAALDRLVDVDDADSMVITALSGTAGVGKTALAVRWAHRVRDRFPDGQLYVDLRGYGPDAPLPPDDALAGFLRALGVEGAAVPQDLDERAAKYRSLLDGRRMLVVLDNARTVDQVRPLLPGTASCVVLITSRDSLSGLGVREGAQRLDLDRLAVAEARDLMTHVLDDKLTGDAAALDELIEQCARLPLALRIAADLVRTRPARGVAGLVTELADERDRLDLLEVDEDTHSAARAVFSWSYRQLPPDTARLFRMCGLHPGRDVDAYALTALVGSDLRATRRHLDVLVRAHLLDEASDGRFHLHDLLRAYARELAEQDAGVADAVARLVAYYLHAVATAMDRIAPLLADRRPTVAVAETEAPSFTSPQDARRWLDRERSNLLGLASDHVDAYTVTLSGLLAGYLDRGAYYDEARDLHTWAVAAARRRQDAAGEAAALRQLAGAHYFLGDPDRSAALVESALELYRQSGDVKGQAAALSNLGTVHNQRGQQRTALRYYEEAMALRRELGSPTTSMLTNTGAVLMRLGRHDEAHSHFEEAGRIAEEAGDQDSAASSLVHLAEVSLKRGRVEEALDLANRALDLAREVGARSIEVDAMVDLGEVWRHLGDTERAASYHQQALDLARASGDNSCVVWATTGLARVHAAGGAADRAIAMYENAVELAARHQLRDEEAAGHDGLGDLYAEQDDPESARGHWRQALEIWTDLDVPEVDLVRAKLDSLG